MYPTDGMATFIHKSSNKRTNWKGEAMLGRKGVKMYMAGYNPRTHRKPRSAPSFDMTQGITVGWVTALKIASVKKIMLIVLVSKPNPTLERGNEMPLGVALSAGWPLPPASRARKVPMRESEPTLRNASKETARIYNITLDVKARSESSLTGPSASKVSESDEARGPSHCSFGKSSSKCSSVASS
jgi:hypothetical protein